MFKSISETVTVYSPRSASGGLAQVVRSLIRDTVRSRHMVWEMLKRDLTSQYRQSVLGVFLSLLPALTTTAWAVLFRSARLINVGHTNVPYPFFVLCGMMIWAAFTEAMEAPIQGVLAEQALLSRASIPPEAVTFARLGQVFVNFFVKTLIVAAAALIYGIRVPWTAVLAPLGVCVIVALGAGIGMILAPLNLLYRDVSRAMPVVMTFWFFLTPIIFVSPGQGIASVLMEEVNPVTQLLMATRNLIFPGSGGPRGGLWAAAVFAIALFFVGLIFHRAAMQVVIDRANS